MRCSTMGLLAAASVGSASRCAGVAEVKLLLIRETPEGFFLERRTESGEAAGDTQYETLDDAVRFAHSEYDPISDWRVCPDDVDPLEFIRARSDP